jgi:hypothetical protein
MSSTNLTITCRCNSGSFNHGDSKFNEDIINTIVKPKLNNHQIDDDSSLRRALICEFPNDQIQKIIETSDGKIHEYQIWEKEMNDNGKKIYATINVELRV